MPEITEAQVRAVAQWGVFHYNAERPSSHSWRVLHDAEDQRGAQGLDAQGIGRYLDPAAIAEAIRQKPCATCGGAGEVLQLSDFDGEPVTPCPAGCTNGLLPPAEPELRAMIEGAVG